MSTFVAIAATGLLPLCKRAAGQYKQEAHYALVLII